MAERLAESSPVSPAGATPPVDFDDTLGRAIDAGRLDPALAADARLAAAFAAHQKLEVLFAALRGEPADDLCRERPPWRSEGPVWPPVDEPAPAQLGRYQVQSTLGIGAFGTVYLARDPELHRDVAIKVSRAGTFASTGALDKFRVEARHAASLNHPNIVTIYDVGREGERLYIVMQYVAGQTLADAIAAGPLAPAPAAELLATVADALHYAHKHGFVHRDMKPANILLDDQGRPHVADFGLAVNDETQRALAGQVVGTPEYMAPEQARGESHRLDGRTDIWALGVILYELLTGRRPFGCENTPMLLDAVEHRNPKPPRQIDGAIPAELERIILKCLAKQPTERYNTASDVAADLRRWDLRRVSRMQGITRSQAASIGTETLRILTAGQYWTADGYCVQIGELVRRAIAATRSYPPEQRFADTHFGNTQTFTDVSNESALAAARRLIDEGYRPVVLNFASATNPGGGFLTDACAQEESLARSSGLFACLNGHAMYDLHRMRRDPMYTAYAVYSPEVPVFRDDGGHLLPEPYLCSFISSPAVNAKSVLRRDPSRRSEIGDAMWERILKVLAVAAKHEHEALVLGAWGCGAFGNDSQKIASLFERALANHFTNAFQRVVFAIVDWSAEERFIGPFKEAFASWNKAASRQEAIDSQ